MKNLCATITIVLLAAVLAGCSSTGTNLPPVSALKGDDVVLILWHDSQFNVQLRDALSNHAVSRGFKVVSDEEFHAGRYKATDYAAVVILAKHEAKGSMEIVDAFVEKYGKGNSIVVGISHEWDVESSSIRKNYDALTAASKDFEQEEILNALKTRLDSVLQQRH